MASLKAQRFPRISWSILGITLLLGGIGVLNLNSAAATGVTSETPIYLKQAFFLLIGTILGTIVTALDYRRWLDYSYVLYGICVLMLAAVLFFGKSISGAQRWLSIGFLTFQPSELCKWVILLVLARYFQRYPKPEDTYGLWDVMRPLGLIGLPAILIVMEPDLGTTIIFLLIAGTVLMFAGFRVRSCLKLVALILLALPLIWQGLEDYQRNRLMTFLEPQRDPLGSGYHLTQSKIAIGSGGLLGKGFREGTQSQLRFLPEHHTDFAFSVWAEEWGFVGSLGLLSLLFLMLVYGLHVAYRAVDLGGKLLAFGVVAFFFWPTVINVGMTLGLMPVVGVALPFISYGGSSLMTSMMAVGILVNVHMRRFMF